MALLFYNVCGTISPVNLGAVRDFIIDIISAVFNGKM